MVWREDVIGSLLAVAGNFVSDVKGFRQVSSRFVAEFLIRMLSVERAETAEFLKTLRTGQGLIGEESSESYLRISYVTLHLLILRKSEVVVCRFVDFANEVFLNPVVLYNISQSQIDPHGWQF